MTYLDYLDNRPLAAALSYAERGWHVFPLRPGDKRPAFPTHPADRCTGSDPRCRTGHTGWEQRATTDPARIRCAWTAREYGIGIACGPSGLVVIDLDLPKTVPPVAGEGSGVASFRALCQRAGQPEPTSTYTVRTGRGGVHLYYLHPAAGLPLRNTAGSLGPLIDTRSHGGYVVAPPTAVAGRCYTTTCERRPVMLPAWLAELLRPTPLPDQAPMTTRVAADRRTAYLDAALTGEVARVVDSPPHQHNNALYHAAVALGQLVAGGAVDEFTVTTLLSGAARTVGQPDGEAARTIASGLRAGARRPRQVAA